MRLPFNLSRDMANKDAGYRPATGEGGFTAFQAQGEQVAGPIFVDSLPGNTSRTYKPRADCAWIEVSRCSVSWDGGRNFVQFVARSVIPASGEVVVRNDDFSAVAVVLGWDLLAGQVRASTVSSLPGWQLIKTFAQIVQPVVLGTGYIDPVWVDVSEYDQIELCGNFTVTAAAGTRFILWWEGAADSAGAVITEPIGALQGRDNAAADTGAAAGPTTPTTGFHVLSKAGINSKAAASWTGSMLWGAYPTKHAPFVRPHMLVTAAGATNLTLNSALYGRAA